MVKKRIILILSMAFLIFTPSLAFANSITEALPKAGSVITEQPNSISITTLVLLSEQGSQIVVNDPNGVAVDDASITINGNTAVVGLFELVKTGVYTVNYTLLSEADDPLNGSYTFLFNAPATLATPTPTPTPSTMVENQGALNSSSNAFVYTLLVLALFVFIFLIWYAKVSFGGSKKPKRK